MPSFRVSFPLSFSLSLSLYLCVYVCVCVCVCVWRYVTSSHTSVNIYIHICTLHMFMYTYVCIYTCIHVYCVYTCIHVYFIGSCIHDHHRIKAESLLHLFSFLFFYAGMKRLRKSLESLWIAKYSIYLVVCLIFMLALTASAVGKNKTYMIHVIYVHIQTCY